jgi:hypothetical protein
MPKKRETEKQLKQPQENKMDSVGKKAWLDWGKAVIIGIIGSVAAYYLVEYFMEPMKSDTFSYYYVLNTIPVTAKKDSESSVNELNDMFSVVVKPDKPLNINHIKIHNIAKMVESSLYCSENDINKVIAAKVKMLYNSELGILTVSDIPTIPAKSKLIINVLGVIDSDQSNPVIVLEDNKMIWPIEAKLVTETRLFLARYWQLVLTINLLCILSVYYFLKTRLRL